MTFLAFFVAGKVVTPKTGGYLFPVLIWSYIGFVLFYMVLHGFLWFIQVLCRFYYGVFLIGFGTVLYRFQYGFLHGLK